MNSRNVVLPESLVPFVADRVARGGYSSAEDYVRALIEADRLRETEDRLEALVDEAIDSGPTIPVDREFWAERRRKLAESRVKATGEAS